MYAKIRKNETSESLIKRFTRKCKKEGILEEYRERQYYKKPSVKKREQKAKNIANVRRQERKKELAEKRFR
jgi:small subunit ribosomal protein S21